MDRVQCSFALSMCALDSFCRGLCRACHFGEVALLNTFHTEIERKIGKRRHQNEGVTNLSDQCAAGKGMSGAFKYGRETGIRMQT